MRAGAARLVWGRLDEFQPTDVVNPIDLSRFLMEGRSEARLPVGLVRGRVFLPRSTTLEAVVVPHFRRGRFDQLDEPSSPFNLAVAAADRVPLRRVPDEPRSGRRESAGWRAAHLDDCARRLGRVRLPRDHGRFRFRRCGRRRSTVEMPSLVIRESFPRFTMIGGDFETVRGAVGRAGRGCRLRGRRAAVDAGRAAALPVTR